MESPATQAQAAQHHATRAHQLLTEADAVARGVAHSPAQGAVHMVALAQAHATTSLAISTMLVPMAGQLRGE